MVVGFTWATGASVNFMAELLPEDRKAARRWCPHVSCEALGVYPVWLFYVGASKYV